MTRILVTGFEPFGGEPVNPSWELVRELLELPEGPPGLELVGGCLPVTRDQMPVELDALVARTRPQAVLALGQATARPQICLERTAVNRLCYGELADNAGETRVDQPLESGGPQQLRSVLPLAELARVLAHDGHPVCLSDDAGLFLCNAALWHLLRQHPTLPAAFIHLPLLPSQAERRQRGEPSLDQSVTRRVLVDLLAELVSILTETAPGVA